MRESERSDARSDARNSARAGEPPATGSLRVPEFCITTYVERAYGWSVTRRGSSLFVQSPFKTTTKPKMRLYPRGESGAAHGGFVCTSGQKGSVWDLITLVEGLPYIGEPGFSDTLRHVYDVLGLEPVYDEGRPGQTRSTSDLILDVYAALAAALVPIAFRSPNAHWDGRRYRGLEPEAWLELGVGMLPERALRAFTDHFGLQALRAAGLALGQHTDPARWWVRWLAEGVVVIRHTRTGRPAGVMVRRYDERGGPKAVKNTNHEMLQASHYLFGEHELRRYAHRRAARRPASGSRRTKQGGERSIGVRLPRVYTVEGEFDQLALYARGLEAVVAHGMGFPTERQMERLRELADEVVIVCDTDQDGAGLQHAIQAAERYRTTLFTFVPETGEKSDPDTFAQAHGVDAFRALPVYTNRQIRMLGEPMTREGRWTEPEAVAARFVAEIAENPGAYERQEEEDVAAYAGLDPSHVRSWTCQLRNEAVLEALRHARTPVPLLLTPAP